MGRRLFAALLVAGVLVASASNAAAGPLQVPAPENVTGVREEYTTTENVDMPATTAEVDTGAAQVMLPLNPCAVSYRAGINQVAVKDTDCIKIYASGAVYLEQASIACPGVISVSYSKDGRFLYACTKESVHKYAATGPSYTQVAKVDAEDLIAVEGGRGHEVWVLHKEQLERWLGSPGGGYSAVSVATLSEGKSLSYSDAKNSVVVLDGGQVRYFAVAGNVTEIAKYGSSVIEAVSLVQTTSAIRVLFPTGSRYYSVQSDGLKEIPALCDNEKGFAIAVPSGQSSDFAVLKKGDGTAGDLSYQAHGSGAYSGTPQKAITDATSEVGYRRQAILVSSTFGTALPVDRLRAVMERTTPAGTSVRLDVSTDGGVTWTADITLDEVCEVAAGPSLTYRLVLTTTDPSDTPIVEALEILQIVKQPYGASLGNSKVRLVP